MHGRSASQRPGGGTDFPRSAVEFAEFFPDEAACHRLLERLRWPNGFVCPACGQAAPAWRDENTFRFNRRTSRSRGKLFYRLLQQAVQVEPVPYRSILADASRASEHSI